MGLSDRLSCHHRRLFTVLKCQVFAKHINNNNNKFYSSSTNRKAYLSIGGAKIEISADKAKSAKVPVGYFERNKESQAYLKHLKWLIQKDVLKQDTFLIGSPPGAYRRHLALAYAEIANREVEYLCLTRDTTEADIKQRREIIDGSIVYKNQCAVNAALNGRLLIIEGIEKAERNLLPILNNLLENREINLDNGQFLVAPDRYDKLVAIAKQSNEVQMGKLNLLRVHQDFRVLAIGLPVPKYKGNPLDPPLRSRFQASLVNMLAYDDHLKQLKNIQTSSTSSSSIVDEQIIENLLNFAHSFYQNDIRVLNLPDFPVENLDRLVTTLKHVKLVANDDADAEKKPSMSNTSHLDIGHLIHSIYPYNLLFKKDESNLLNMLSSLGERYQIKIQPQAQDTNQPVYRLHAFDEQTRSLTFSTRKDPHVELRLKLPATRQQHHSSNISNNMIDDNRSFVLNEYHSSLLVDMCMSCVGFPLVALCLIGERGSGKTALIQKFAQLFGYNHVNTIQLYKDMNSRDLIQQRVTDPNGNTKWTNSVLVDSCLNGDIVVLDGIHRLRDDTLLSLRRLIQDGELDLLDGTRLVSQDKYTKLIDRSSDSISQIKPIHPSFRILCTAELPNPKDPSHNWLTPELLNMFTFHHVQPLNTANTKAIVKAKFNNQLSVNHERLIDFVEALRMSSANDVQLNNISKQFTLRQILRISHKLFAYNDLDLRELIENACLYEFMPKLNKDIFNDFLTKNNCLKKPACQANRALELPTLADNSNNRVLSLNELAKVPDTLFYENQKHSVLLSNFYRDYKLKEHLLLIGNQGTGKNKLVDRFLMLLNKPREYIQLHRDTTVQTLTIQPNISNGVIVYEDSPLVKAIKHGHVLVIDEADKAPVHVMAILKSLIESGEMMLSDGRQIVPTNYTRTNGHPTHVIRTHKDFSLIILANRPGYPFLGNDFFSTIGDLLSCHQIMNPDMESEIEMLKMYAPNTSTSLISKLVNAFNSLRDLVDQGLLNYPYSTREIVNIVKHLEKYPNDSLSSIIRNIYDFDHFNEQNDTKNTFRETMAKYGIPMDNVESNVAYTVRLSQKTKLPDLVKVKTSGDLGLIRIEVPFDVTESQLNWKAVQMASNDPIVVIDAKCDFYEERVDTFSELYRTWILPFKNANSINDMAKCGDFVYVSCLKPISLLRLDLNTNQVKQIRLDSLFPYAWRSYYPQLKILTTTNNVVCIHDEVLNDLYKIDFDNQVEHVAKLGQYLLTETKRKFFIDHTSLFKFVKLSRDGLYALYRRANKTLDLYDLNRNIRINVNLNMKINQLTCMGPNRMLIESTDANKIISTFIIKYADIQSVEPLSHQNIQKNLSLFKVDNLIDDKSTNDAFIRTIQLENIESFKMPDLFKHAFDATTTDKDFKPPILPTLHNHYLTMSNGQELYECKREHRIGAMNDQMLNLKSIVDYKTNKILTQIPPAPRRRDKKMAKVLGSIEINDLNACTVAYVDVMSTKAPMDNTDDEYMSNTESQTTNDANFLMDIRNDSGNLITLDFNGHLSEWEISELSLNRSLDDWYKMITHANNANLEVEILESNENNQSMLDSLNGPKHGKVDQTNAPHVGGNTWAGGSGGRDTAGLGGIGGPYRLDSGNTVYQVNDKIKQNVPEHVRKAAREMAQQAFRQRLNEIKMSEYDHEMYKRYLDNVSMQVKQLKNILDGLEAKKKERQWLKNQLTGDLDDTRLVEAIIGDKNVFKKRGDDKDANNDLQIEKPKRLRLLVDVSGSMYRFNGVDKRLERQLETVLMVMEAFNGYESKIRFDIVGHSGDGYDFKLTDPLKPPENEAERLKLLKTLIAHSQFCTSGDYTLQATKYSIDSIAKEDADDHFVIVLSDANFDRYGISPRTFARVMTETNKNVNVFCIFIGSLGDQAQALKRNLPFGKVFICMNTKDLPNILQQIFQSSLLNST